MRRQQKTSKWNPSYPWCRACSVSGCPTVPLARRDSLITWWWRNGQLFKLLPWRILEGNSCFIKNSLIALFLPDFPYIHSAGPSVFWMYSLITMLFRSVMLTYALKDCEGLSLRIKLCLLIIHPPPPFYKLANFSCFHFVGPKCIRVP